MRTLATLVIGLFAASALAQPFIVDGQFDDWPTSVDTETDPGGDATGQLDVTELSGVLDGNEVFVSLSITEAFNLQSGSSSNPDRKLVIEGGAGPALEARFRRRRGGGRDTDPKLTRGAVR